MSPHWIAIPHGTFAIWAARTSDLRSLARSVFRVGAEREVFRAVTVELDGSDPQPFDYQTLLDGDLPFELPHTRPESAYDQ